MARPAARFSAITLVLPLLACLGSLLLSLKPACAQVSNTVTAWNLAAEKAFRTYSYNIHGALRVYTLLHLAQYKAILESKGKVSHDAVAAYASHRILSTVFNDLQSSQFDSLLQTQENLFDSEDLKPAKKVAFKWADKLIASRASDGSNAWVKFDGTSATGAGEYVFVPGQTYALYPQLGNTGFFGINSMSPFSNFVKHNLSSPEYSSDYDEVFAYGNKTSANRTNDQSDIADFWRDTAPINLGSQWNNITLQLLPSSYNTKRTARALALANVAAYDALIVTWNIKYSARFWRPITAINKGDNISSPPHAPVPTWTTYYSTPPHPEYPSGHSTVSSAFAAVLKQLLGGDAVNVTIPTSGFSVIGRTLSNRTYTSLSSIALEAGLGRIYAGVHFRKSIVDGNAIRSQAAALVTKAFNKILSFKKAKPQNGA